jgi:hypothetical protein
MDKGKRDSNLRARTLRTLTMRKTLKIESYAIPPTSHFIDKLDRKGIKLHIPRHKNLDVLRLGYDVLVGLRRLGMCNFDGLNSLMNELSTSDILPSLNATNVRGHFERILLMEETILKTPDLSLQNRRSVSAACAHVAASFFFNVSENFAIGSEGKNLEVDEKVKLGGDGNVKFDGVFYTATKHMISVTLWHSAVATRYHYVGSSSTMRVKDTLTKRSSHLESTHKIANAMQDWRRKADDIVVQYVEDPIELKIISILLDSCAVGLQHEDAFDQSHHGSLYTLAHSKMVSVGHNRLSGRKEAAWISKWDAKHKMENKLIDHWKHCVGR